MQIDTAISHYEDRTDNGKIRINKIKWKSYKSENLFYILTCIKYAKVFMCAVGISRHVKSIPSVFLSRNSKHLWKKIYNTVKPPFKVCLRSSEFEQ
jgi:NRPS condensation-like uncharacterized protein